MTLRLIQSWFKLINIQHLFSCQGTAVWLKKKYIIILYFITHFLMYIIIHTNVQKKSIKIFEIFWEVWFTKNCFRVLANSWKISNTMNVSIFFIKFLIIWKLFIQVIIVFRIWCSVLTFFTLKSQVFYDLHKFRKLNLTTSNIFFQNLNCLIVIMAYIVHKEVLFRLV